MCRCIFGATSKQTHNLVGLVITFNCSVSVRVSVCLSVRRVEMTSSGGSPRQKCGVNTHGELSASLYNRDLGAEPPAGSRDRTPGLGVRGTKPAEAENFSGFGCPTKAANLPQLSAFCKPPKPQICICDRSLNKLKVSSPTWLDNSVYQQKISLELYCL